MNYKIVERKETIIIGLEERMKLSENKISILWGNFFIRECEIQDKVTGVYYGIADNIEKCSFNEITNNDTLFTETVGVEIHNYETFIPSGMIKKNIPAGEYLVYTHTGPLLNSDGSSRVKESYFYLYEILIPKLKLRISSGFNFEYYDNRFDYNNSNSEFDIYVPITRKDD